MKTENVTAPTEKAEKTAPEEAESAKKPALKAEAPESPAKQKSIAAPAIAAPAAASVAAPASTETVVKPEVRGEAIPPGEARVIVNPGGVHL